MSDPFQAAICLLANGLSLEVFRRCLESVLNHTPAARIELRLAFSMAAGSLNYTAGALASDGACLKRQELPEEVERFEWSAQDGLLVRAWHSARRLSREHLARLMVHDLPLEADYAILLDQSSFVEAGWWDALVPLLEQGTDYIGQPRWRDYLPGEAEQIQTYRWYMGVPVARREGRPGVSYMSGGFVAVRAERLRQANFPEPGWAPGSDALLGAIAHQLRWTQAVHDRYVHLTA